MKRALYTLCALVLVLVLPAWGKPHVLDLSNPTSEYANQQDTYLEKYNIYPWPADYTQLVRNSSGCVWDINDHQSWYADGDLAPGASASTQGCIVWGFNPMYVSRNGLLAWWSSVSNWYGTRTTAPSPDLAVSVCLSVPARCFPLSPTKVDRKTYSYALCVQAVYNPDDPAMSLIPDSTPSPLISGSTPGVGALSYTTLNVSNPTTRVIKAVQVRWGFSSDVVFPAGCVVTSQRPPVTHDYPLAWYP